ncbi:MAG: SMC-Scp complex subunit ScpB [Terracidiphilus sp.]|jgi:segregation and condensation protein B
MSLKAKLEAVIYAAEEPVTLTQLAALFAAEALEWRAQEEAVSADRASSAGGSTQTLPLGLTEDFVPADEEPVSADPGATEPVSESVEVAIGTEPETTSEIIAEPSAETSQEAGQESSTGPIADAAAETIPEIEPSVDPAAPNSAPLDAPEFEAATTGEDAVPSAEAAELEARRQARQLDREVRVVIRQLLDELIASCASDGRGVEIREIAGGYRVATKPECHDAVRLFVRSLKPALKLSLPALETLAVIAYKQPVTAPEVNEIRGVDSSGVFGSLLARKLIATAGRKQVIGRPILYKTTREFLLRFGLKDVTELPSMEEFEKLAAIELDEPETATGDDSEQRSNPALAPEGPEFDESASEELEDSSAADLETPIEPSESTGTAETAVSNEPPPPPEEAAPAAPPAPEQAEIETPPHGEEEN